MSKGLSFYYTIIFTGLSTIKAIGSSFHRYQQSPKDALKYFQHFQHRVRVSFFYKTANLRPGALLKMRHFDKGVFFPVNFVKFFRTHFYRTPPVVTFSYHTLKKNKTILSSFSLFRFAMGSYIKDVRTNLGIFGTLSPCPGLSTFGGHLVFFILFIIWKYFFFYVGFLSRTFTIHRNAGEGEDYLFNISLLLPPASQTLQALSGWLLN